MPKISKDCSRKLDEDSGRTAKLSFTNEKLRMEIARRRHVEEMLRESEKRYRAVVENQTELICRFRPDYTVTFVNDALCTYFSKTREELMGESFLPLVFEGDRSKIAAFYRTFTPKKTHDTNEHRVILQNLEVRWQQWNASAIFDENGELVEFQTVGRDITKAKQREMETKREAKALRQQNIKLASTMKDRYRFGNLVGKSGAMQDVYEQILAASSTNANVVVYGESGTGKELVATAVHELSDRSEGTFVPVNCGAIPENLMESEFFGHKKGAFTGADTDKLGYLDFANRGTLFLDEVGNVSRGVQIKLLRAIEGGGHTPLGSNQVRKSDFRIIAAANRPLMDIVKEGRMREDFFFRVHIVPIYLPPLRERKEDIVLLLDHFIRSMSHGKAHQILSGKILDAFVEYDWPGNVRELQNVLQRYLTIGRLEFASGWQARKPLFEDADAQPQTDGDDFRLKVEGFEKRLVLRSLEKCRWRRSLVCKDLGIPRRTLFNKMKKYGLDLHKLG